VYSGLPGDPRAGQGDALHFKTLHGCAVVSGPEHSLDDEIMRQYCQRFGIQVSKVHRADNIDAVMALVRRGKGAALGSASFAKRYGLAAIPMLPESEIALNLLCLKQNENNPLVRMMEHYLKTYVAQKTLTP
jgi:DNA-binding transcriptional LysR family regulator